MTEPRVCRSVVVFRGPKPTATRIITGSVSRATLSIMQPYGSPQIEALAAAKGGCVRMAITIPFTPNRSTQNPYLPLCFSTDSVRKVDINGYVGWLAIVGRVASHPITQLTIEMPQGNGQIRDVAISSTDLTLEDLLTVVSRVVR